MRLCTFCDISHINTVRLNARSPQEAVEYTKKMMADLFTNKHDIHMLIITKRIMNWEGKRKQPHVELAKR